MGSPKGECVGVGVKEKELQSPGGTSNTQLPKCSKFLKMVSGQLQPAGGHHESSLRKVCFFMHFGHFVPARNSKARGLAKAM